MVAGPCQIDNRHVNKKGSGPRWLLVLAFGLLAAPGVTGCGTSQQGTVGWTAHPAGAPTPMATMHSETADTARQAAWASRPVYVRSDARTEEAYAFAMASPQVLQWMPCYCGCEAMGHGSNLDCFFKPTMDGLTNVQFEEHASYCGICVDTALMAKRMLAEGQSLRAIRDAVDTTFGSAAPGTPTELPPA
jgi:hypothetical protein